ncbi:Poly ADP-ribose polymerase 1 [Nymphaea thermarum]|nr:Poly ADP-ribose polymerase 1 [Nymphaea thermarum]
MTLWQKGGLNPPCLQDQVPGYLGKVELPDWLSPIHPAWKGTIEDLTLSAPERTACPDVVRVVRVSAKPDVQGNRGVSWYHANCYVDIHPSIRVEELRGWVDLPNEEKVCLTRVSKKEALDNEVSQQSRGTKRKKAVTTENQKKVPKAEENASARSTSTKNKATELGKVGSDAAILERKLEEQTKALWAVKDDLRKHVKTVELREMLEANNQDSAGSEYDLRERW